MTSEVHTNLLKPLKVLSEEGHGPVRPGGAQLDNAVLQQLLNVVFLHILLTLPQAPLLFAACTSRCHDDNCNPSLRPVTFVLERGGEGGAYCHFITAQCELGRLTENYTSVWECLSRWERDRQKTGECEKHQARMRSREMGRCFFFFFFTLEW